MPEVLISQSEQQTLPTGPKEVLSTSKEAQTVLKTIYDSPGLLDDEQSIEPKTGLEALQSKLFLDTTNLMQSNPDIVINVENHTQPIDVPADFVVDAQGFMSWEGRAKGVNKTISTNEGYQTLPSLDIIKKYAVMDRSKRPIIPEMNMFVQKDGKVFLGNSNDGSHRLAAAIFNGEKTIPTLSLRVRYIDNLIF